MSPAAGFSSRWKTGPFAAFLNSGHFGRPLPFGSPVFAKLIQYAETIAAIFASVGEANASSGELLSGYKRNVPRLSNT